MKIVFDIYLDEVVILLCLAAAQDEELTDRNLSKAQIKRICETTVRNHGMNALDGWSDELTEMEAATINGWAYAQARKYTW